MRREYRLSAESCHSGNVATALHYVLFALRRHIAKRSVVASRRRAISATWQNRRRRARRHAAGHSFVLMWTADEVIE